MQKLLIRVPAYDRDWRVPLKEELDVDYFLDATHYIEYTQEAFKQEVSEAGLSVASLTSIWGELWAVVTPSAHP